MSRITQEQRDAARAMYETGASKDMIAEEFDVAVSTVSGWVTRYEWSRDEPVFAPEEEVPTTDSGGTPFGFSEEETVELEETNLDLEQMEIQRLAARVAELEDQLDEERSVKEVKLPATDEEAVEWVGRDRLDEIIELRLAALNRERTIRGQFPIDWRTQPDMWERAKKEVVKDVLDARTKFADASLAPLRTVKMWFNGTIVQVPHELQFNNEAAQPGTSIWKMRDKGAKLVMPLLCHRLNCWLESATHPDGSLMYQGYCSPAHLATDPYQGDPTPGVSTVGGGKKPANVMDLTGRR